MIKCVNCGHENLETALVCYWCGLNPNTGKQPYESLATPSLAAETIMPPAIEIPAPMPVPGAPVGLADLSAVDLTMPDVPSIEITPPPAVSDLDGFAQTRRKRMRHRPISRHAPTPPRETRPVLPNSTRLLVLVAGLAVLYALGAALVGAASLGNAFCLLGLLSLGVVVWVGLLLARTGQQIATATGEVYKRLELLGQALHEVAPGKMIESPVNLPSKLGLLDLPVAFSELRYLGSQKGEQSTDLAVDLLTGAIASLVARDDAVLARRAYPVEVRGLLTRPSSRKVEQPVLTRRRVYVGPGRLEEEVAKALRTDRPMTVLELMYTLLGEEQRRKVKRLIAWVDQALANDPPDLDALAVSPDEALAELEKYRTALRRADPELYQLVEDQVRRGLGAVARRSVSSSLLDMIQQASTSSSSRRS
jgi:hypothetical protein